MATGSESHDLKRKRADFYSDNEEEESSESDSSSEDEGLGEDEEDGEEEELDEATPVGDPIRRTKRKEFFNACEVNDVTYKVGDIVALRTDEGVESFVGEIMALPMKLSSHPKKQVKLKVLMRWFYRPEEAIKKNGTTWQPGHPRELYFSSHTDDENDAGTILEKVTIYFVPPSKPIPPIPEGAYVVRYLYDHDEKNKMLFPISDTDFVTPNLTRDLQRHMEATNALLASMEAPPAPVLKAESKPKAELGTSAGPESLHEGTEVQPAKPEPAKPESAKPEPAPLAEAAAPPTVRGPPVTVATTGAGPSHQAGEPKPPLSKSASTKSAQDPSARSTVQLAGIPKPSKTILLEKQPDKRPRKLAKVGAGRGSMGRASGKSTKQMGYGVKDPGGKDVQKDKEKKGPPTEEGKALENLGLLIGNASRDAVREKFLSVLRECKLRPTGRQPADAVAAEKPAEKPVAVDAVAAEKPVADAGPSGEGEEVAMEWPEKYVQLMVELETVLYKCNKEAFAYKQKSRSMVFNFKTFPVTLERFLNGQLSPSVIASMTPDELKHGKTKAEMPTTRVETPAPIIQYTDATCKDCKRKRVVVQERTMKPGTMHEIMLLLSCKECGADWRTSSNEFHLQGHSILNSFPPDPKELDVPKPDDEEQEAPAPSPLATEIAAEPASPRTEHIPDPPSPDLADDGDAPAGGGEQETAAGGGEKETAAEGERGEENGQGHRPEDGVSVDVERKKSPEIAAKDDPEADPGYYISEAYPGVVWHTGKTDTLKLDRPLFRFELPKWEVSPDDIVNLSDGEDD